MKSYTFFYKYYETSFRFAILPLLTILLGKFLFEILAFDFPQLSTQVSHYVVAKSTTSTSLEMLQESKARLLWTSSALVYFFVNSCFFIFLWHTFNKVFHSKKCLLVFIASFLSIIEIIFLFSIDSFSSPLHYIFFFSFDALTTSKLYSHEQLTFIYYILSLINFIAITVVPFSVITACGIVLQKPTNIAQINKQFVLLKDFINGSSAVMIAGIIHMQLWLSWPLSFIIDSSHINELENFISTIIQYWGICYSLTIAALYLPIAAYLRNKEEELALTTEQISTKTPQYGQSTKNNFPQIIAILGPIIVGSFSAMLTDIFTV